MTATRLNPTQTNLVKSVAYYSGISNHRGNVSFTHSAPSGYKLLVNRPIGAYASGDEEAYITDRYASQSGSTVTVSLYVRNPNSRNVDLGYSLIYVLA